MAPSQLSPNKKQIVSQLLEGSDVFVHIDPRHPKANVPQHFRQQPQLVLQIGLNMVVPIPDLEVNDDGIGCTLSFNRSPFWCWLPWASIYAVVSDDRRGMVWPEDVPPELADKFGVQPSEQRHVRLAATSSVTTRPHLASVPPPAAAEPPEAVAKPRKRAAAKKPKEAPSDTAELQGAAPKPRKKPSARRKAAPQLEPQPALPLVSGPQPTPAPAAQPAPQLTFENVSAPTSTPAGPTRKRELPPYLRVVK